MASDHPADVLPMLPDTHPGFATAMRGYDRGQVDEFLAQLDEDLRGALADRDALAGRSADLAAQLASASAQIESLRRQLRKASESVTAENIDTRLGGLLSEARAEATKIRSAAEAEAAATTSGANDAAARTRATALSDAEEILASALARHADADETFRRRLAEAEHHRAEVEERLVQSIAQARAEEDRVTAEAEATRVRQDAEALAERERLDAEARAARRVAEEDFELVLRRRRSAEAAASAEQTATAEAEAAQRVANASAQARALVDDAIREVRRLHGQRDEAHAHLRELIRKLGAALEHVLAHTPPEPEGTD